MMLKKFLLLSSLIILGNCVNGQVSRDSFSPGNFNVAVSTGIMGIHSLYLPALEVKTYNLTTRASLGFRFYSIGFDYEFGQFQTRMFEKLFKVKSGMFVASAHCNIQYNGMCLDKCITSRNNQIYSLLFGVKYYYGPRHSIVFKVGAAVNSYTEYNRIPFVTSPPKRGLEYFPFGELSVKIYLLKRDFSQ